MIIRRELLCSSWSCGYVKMMVELDFIKIVPVHELSGEDGVFGRRLVRVRHASVSDILVWRSDLKRSC